MGKPKMFWRLSDAGHGRFPDTHAEMTVNLIDLTRETFGESGLNKLVKKHEARQKRSYRDRVAEENTLESAVEALRLIRTDEGYMAETHTDGNDILLIEHHCPICAAATSCRGFCEAELRVFQHTLKPFASVVREEHLLSGGERCRYRIVANS